VCARELAQTETQRMLISAIPNGQALAPSNKHPAHQYTCGLLLHVSAITTTVSGAEGAVWLEGKSRPKKNKLPKLALANGMWIGDIPFVLSVLTLPEQILI